MRFFNSRLFSLSLLVGGTFAANLLAQCPGLEPSDLSSYQKGFDFVGIATISKVKHLGAVESSRPKEHPKALEVALAISKTFKGEDLLPKDAEEIEVKTRVFGKEGAKILKKWTKGTELLVFAKYDKGSSGFSADYCDLIAGERIERLTTALEKLDGHSRN